MNQEDSMKSEISLYEYLYQLLLSQLHCGILRYGQSLPSQTELCRKYNVGITTVRRVVHMLEEDGYIKTGKRRRSVVTYQVDTETYIHSLLQKKQMVLDVFDGFKLILPVLQLEGARQYSDLETLEKLVAGIHSSMEEHELYTRASHFFMELLSPFDNQVMYDLHTDSVNFTYLPYLPVSELDITCSITPELIQSSLMSILDSLRMKDYKTLELRLNEIYDYGRDHAKDYMNAIESCCTCSEPEAPVPDYLPKNRAFLYTVIARLLYRRIQNGEFDHCKYIPSIPDLMKEYSISQVTAFHAVDLLNDIGVVQTIDKKGTVIAAPQSEPSPLRIDQTAIRQNLSLFLDSLQILMLCSRPLASAVLSELKVQDIREVLSVWEQMDLTSSGSIVRTVLKFLKDYAPQKCLCTLFEQMDYLLIWGHYLQRDLSRIREIDDRIPQCFPLLCDALSSQNIPLFSDYVHSIFTSAYEMSRKLMLS